MVDASVENLTVFVIAIVTETSLVKTKVDQIYYELFMDLFTVFEIKIKYKLIFYLFYLFDEKYENIKILFLKIINSVYECLYVISICFLYNL